MCPAWDDEAQSTKNVFFCLDAGNAPSFYMFLPSQRHCIAVRVVTCCYMLLLGLLFDSGWLRTAFKVKHLWTCCGFLKMTQCQSWWRITSTTSIIIFAIFWAGCLGFPWFTMIFTESLSETGRLQYLAKFAFSFWSIESPFVLVNVCSLGVAK